MYDTLFFQFSTTSEYNLQSPQSTSIFYRNWKSAIMVTYRIKLTKWIIYYTNGKKVRLYHLRLNGAAACHL